jgi:hypothetical protein
MKTLFLSALLLTTTLGCAQTPERQEMDNYKMDAILHRVADTVEGIPGRWQFLIKDRLFLAVTDANANRMRIMSPVVEIDKLDEEIKTKALLANFHSVLDAKYAISDEYLWSVFIHPLKELTEAQLEDAIYQVYNANVTFGSSFSSTNLIFPGTAGQKAAESEKEEEPVLKKKSKF